MKKITSFWKIILLTFIPCLIISCQSEEEEKKVSTVLLDSIQIDLPQIRERGKLIAITSYSSTSYFLYRGQPMGYEYELLERLANHLNLDLEIVIAKNLDEIIDMLLNGKGDVIAHFLTITKERKKKIAFTEHHTITKQVLVQRKPENWRQMKLHNIEKQLIRNPLDLIGQKVYVRKNSSYYYRLLNLSEEMGGDIELVPVSGNQTTGEIIKKVAEGGIDYTVADENIALINATYYSDLDVETAVSFPQRIAWAVRKSSPELLKVLNEWIQNMKKTTDYYVIYNKYFKNKKAFKRRIKSEFFSKTGGKISRYDKLIRTYAGQISWDWRLLASLVYQESRFNPKTESWAGARGLMQLMPATAKQFGAVDLFDPEQSFNAGAAYLNYLQNLWIEIPDSLERLKFVIASYNAGEGHVADARRLAEKYKKNSDKWKDNVDQYILLKSNPTYYNDEVVKYGYCRGEEPYNYVKEIMERYEHYKKFISFTQTN